MRCRTGGSIRNRNTAGTCNSYRLPTKTHKPIAPVAALTAQPLAALPPYGCGVPFTGGERHGGLQYAPHCLYGARLSDLSLRGAKRRGNLAEPDRTTGKSSAKSQLPSRDCTPRALPRASRSGRHVGLRPPRNDTSGGSVVHQRPPAVEFPCAGRSLSAATPHTSAFPILTIACANRQCPMGRRGRRPLQRPTGSLVLTFHFPFPAFSLFSYNTY